MKFSSLKIIEKNTFLEYIRLIKPDQLQFILQFEFDFSDTFQL